MSAIKVPPWKLIPGSGFVVDGFRHAGAPGIKAYFLSHAHSDHYAGITDRWDAGEIFCSEVTGRLIVHILGVGPEYVRRLPLNTPQQIHGVEVTLVDANHCPGAVQFLFRLQDGRCYIHCGDMRFHDSLVRCPLIQGFKGCDAVFLDTTYCNPKHRFPSQEESVDFVVQKVGSYLRAEAEGGKRHLFVISTYTIGKEKILTAVARAHGLKIECTERKMGTLRCLGIDEATLQEVFTSNEGSSSVLLASWGALGETWPYFRPNWTKLEALRQERGADKAVGFVPTGWTYKADAKEFPVHEKDGLAIHLVPYSEHSSFDELQSYVRFLRPKQVIPTVGVGGDNGKKNRSKMLEHFRNLVDMQSSKADFLRTMQRTAAWPPSAPDDEHQDGCEGPNYNVQAEQPLLSADDNSTQKDPENIERIDSERAEQQPAPPALQAAEERPGVREVLAVLEGEVSADGAAKLLNLTGGDVARAINMHYDSKPAPTNQPKASSTSKRSAATSPSAAQTPRKKRPTSLGSTGSQMSIMSFIGGRAPRAKAVGALAQGAEPPQVAESAMPHLKAESTWEAPPRDGRVDAAKLTLPPAPTSASKSTQRRLQSGRTGQAASQEGSQPGNGQDSRWEGMPIPLLTPVQEDSCDNSYGSHAAMDEAAKGPVCAGSPEGDGRLPTCSGRGLPVLPAGECPGKDLCQPAKGGELGDLEASTSGCSVMVDPHKYDPSKSACWRPGEAAPYLHLSRTFSSVIATTKRISIRDAFTNCFRAVLRNSPEDLLPAAYLACGKLAPDHENIELNVGGATVASAVVEATGTSRNRIREMYRDLGDLGDVAQSCRRNQVMLVRPAPLTIRGVFATLRKIAEQKGSGSGGRRQRLVLGLLRSAREEETRFLVRMLVQNLRVGANWRSIMGALGRAAAIHHSGAKNPSKAELDKADAETVAAFHMCPSLDVLVPALLEAGPSRLGEMCQLKPGVPIKPMLAKAADGVDDVLRTMAGAGALLAEYKYDGQRAQVHLLEGGQVRIFSRNGEDKTVAFPDVAELVVEAAAGGAKSLIIDAELVAVDRENGNRLKAFQELSTRARGSITSAEVKVQVAVFVFDLLLFDGESMVSKTLRQRRDRLALALPNRSPGRVELARSIEVGVSVPEADDAPGKQPVALGTPDPKAGEDMANASPPDEETVLQGFLLESLENGAEGLMVKQLDRGAYEPSKRSESWLKVKRDYVEGLRDSLDLVPIGAWYGNGRKAGWLSPFLLAAWDPDREEFQSVCRVMSGFSDRFYAEATERLGINNRIEQPKPYYVTGETCNVWFEPVEVWEIRGADLTVSPVHKAAWGHLHADRGVSMRFPRFIRLRPDKTPMEASGPDVIVELFNRQTRKAQTLVSGQPSQAAAGDDEAEIGEVGREGDGDSAEDTPDEEEQAAAETFSV